jgi:serine/threonine-protein kinase RsbW
VAKQPGLEPPQALNWPIHFEIERNLPDLWRHLEQIERQLAGRGLAAADVGRVILILEELLTNVIKYETREIVGASGPISLTIGSESVDLSIGLSSRGTRFDPRHRASAEVSTPLAERAIGGLGLVLVNQLADDLDYRHEDGRNHIDIRLASVLDGL